jgi:hypothetical protein
VNLALQVFLPALSFNQHKADTGLGASSADVPEMAEHEPEQPSTHAEAVEYHSAQLIRDEFLMNIQKFEGSIQRTIQQLEGRSPSMNDRFTQGRPCKSLGGVFFVCLFGWFFTFLWYWGLNSGPSP